jgi:hypothetical protein
MIGSTRSSRPMGRWKRRRPPRRRATSTTKYELEKARVADAKGLRPSTNFDLSRFEAQNQEAQNEWEQAKNDADARVAEASDLQKTYDQAQKQYLEMKGK